MRNNGVTSQRDGYNILERIRVGLEISCVSRFSSGLCSPFVTQQRRRNGRRLVHKVMNNGFEILDKVNFSFDLRVNFRSILRAILSSSLGNIARKNFFRVLKKSSGHSWDILAFSCEMWRSAAHLVEGTPDFLRSNSLKQNDRLLRGEQHEGRGYMAYILDGIKRYFYGLNHLSTDNI